MSTTGYRIKEVSERSGFSAPTLRYYEEIGLLPEASRSASGYRQYDARTLDRLAFIARAKQLGCTLDEIADLTTAWDGGQCGPVQDRLRALVADKRAATQSRLVELIALSSELERAAALLERHRPEGPCDDRCGCVAVGDEDVAAIPEAVALTAKPATAEMPTACTLGVESLQSRLDEWSTQLVHATARSAIDGGVRLELAPATPADELMRLVAGEQRCCSFFRFAITVDERGLGLEVRAPEDALPIVHDLFGAPW
jgi:DNA-binding transcriptional MerR regulator